MNYEVVITYIIPTDLIASSKRVAKNLPFWHLGPENPALQTQVPVDLSKWLLLEHHCVELVDGDKVVVVLGVVTIVVSALVVAACVVVAGGNDVVAVAGPEDGTMISSGNRMGSKSVRVYFD